MVWKGLVINTIEEYQNKMNAYTVVVIFFHFFCSIQRMYNFYFLK